MSFKKLLPAMVVVIVVPLVSFWAASGRSSTTDMPSAGSDDGPARLETVPGAGVHRVVLSEAAAERIGIETAPVTARERYLASAASEAGGQSLTIPYAAVLYDAQGNTWVYTSPEPLVFVRHRVNIDFIDGGDAVLSDGPPPGTRVVTVGAAQLFGTELFGPEFEVGQ